MELAERIPKKHRGTAALIAVLIGSTGIQVTTAVATGLFERFSQADETTTRKFGGTGLGLAISKQLAALMSGSLELTSQEGIGTTFTLRLPLLPAQSGGVRPGFAAADVREGDHHLPSQEDELQIEEDRAAGTEATDAATPWSAGTDADPEAAEKAHIEEVDVEPLPMGEDLYLDRLHWSKRHVSHPIGWQDPTQHQM